MKPNLTSSASFYPTSINMCFLRACLLGTLKKSNILLGLHRKRSHPFNLFKNFLHKDFEKRKTYKLKNKKGNLNFESFRVISSMETEK